ncbi:MULTISPECIES: hypothetical protein [Prevotellaceae]|uniref:hypothetical protein n=1 Tax=Prevotellaceae TaxID=171552 RepID=UPI0003D2E1B1|nr:hypothetical protein [Prevotella phocaeensis]ETD21437.1 hypothetical protein HMPREF1199_00511 [Hoylesella oralis CC98A]
MQEVTNFARFYGLLRYLSFGDNDQREEFKKSVVSQYTNGRTESLREIRRIEYDALCSALEDLTGMSTREKIRQARYAELKQRRSVCLKLMQRLGVDTTDWARVDDFCMHPRLAGKPFRKIDGEELEALAVKLRTIERKGGLKPRREEKKSATSFVYIPIGNIAES